MRRSKLETYVDILKVLAQKGPLKLTHIMHGANVNCSLLKDYLDYLISKELIEERITKKDKMVYAATRRGIMVLHYFKELKQALPILEEDKNNTPFIY